MQLSATRIKMYRTCPRQFRFAYVDQVPALPTAPLVFGRVIHQVLHTLHEWRVEGIASASEAEVMAVFKEFWEQALQQDAPLFAASTPTPEEYEETAREILRDYLHSHQERPPALLSEFAFELPFEWNSGQHVLVGVIDRIEEGTEGLVIVDYKSGKRKPTAQDVAHDLQLTIYALAAEQLFDLPVEQVEYYHLRGGIEFFSERGEEDYGRLCSEVIPQVITGVERGQFPPRYGYYCRFCDFRDLCRLEGPPTYRKVCSNHQGEEPWPTSSS